MGKIADASFTCCLPPLPSGRCRKLPPSKPKSDAALLQLNEWVPLVPPSSSWTVVGKPINPDNNEGSSSKFWQGGLKLSSQNPAKSKACSQPEFIPEPIPIPITSLELPPPGPSLLNLSISSHKDVTCELANAYLPLK